jgi:hypothetical protein
MTRPGRLAAALVTTLALGPAARAQDVSTSVTETLTVEARGDNGNQTTDDDDYGIAFNRLNVVGTAGTLSVGLRADTVVFVAPPSDPFRDDVRLERLTAAWDAGRVHVEGGDLHRQLGRGLVLAVRKLDEIGVDTTIRGGELRWRVGPFEAAAFGGFTNPSNLDGVNQKHVADTSDGIAGLDLAWKPGRKLALGLFGVFLEPKERELPAERDRSVSGGVSAEWRLGDDAVVVYAEGAFQGRTLAGIRQEGKAAYVEVDVAFSDALSLLVEGLLLDAFEARGSTNTATGNRFNYNRPPTLERIDQEVSNNRDVLGAHARLQWVVPDTLLTLHLNGMFRQTDPRDAALRVDQVHTYAGFEWEYEDGESHLHASGGWRDESRDAAAGGREKVAGMVHAEADWLQRLAPGWSLHLQSLNELRTLKDDRYRRGSLFAGVDRAALGGITFEYGYDTQDESEGARQQFFAGLLTWYATERILLRGTVGTQRGGLKCIAGVCRQWPEFAGARLEVAGRF